MIFTLGDLNTLVSIENLKNLEIFLPDTQLNNILLDGPQVDGSHRRLRLEASHHSDRFPGAHGSFFMTTPLLFARSSIFFAISQMKDAYVLGLSSKVSVLN